MASLSTCPHGHQWEAAPEQAACPVCRAAAAGETAPAAGAGGELPGELTDHLRYRVLGLLGAGGMGAVYRAEHRLMERPVALKVIARGLTDDPAAVERFRREVKAAAHLDHPNIVRAFDADQAGGLHFLVMELVEGTDLGRLVAERGPLPVARACEYVRQAALGLQHAFEHGMVHRDIKPQNLMLTPDGRVKVLDFGLSRFVSETAPAPLSPAEGEGGAHAGAVGGAPLTEAGAVMGTADYIAPEQARDPHTADTRADIYGLGCTLYFLLAGHAPFPDGTFLDKLAAHRERPPRPLTDLRDDVTPPLLRALGRMMAKDPAKRYQSPAEAAAALAPFARGPGRRWWPAAAAAVLLAALGLAGYRYGPDAFRFVSGQGQLVLEGEGPDAQVTVARAGGPGRTINLQAGRRIDLPAGEYEIDLGDEPNGLQLSANEFRLARGGRAVVEVLPDEVRAFKGHAAVSQSVAFSPDGRLVLSGGWDHTLRLWDVESGQELRRFEGHTAGLWDATFSPDGRFALSAADAPDNTLRLWDVATGQELRRFLGHTAAVRKVAFSPDGRWAVSGSWDRTVRLWDVGTGQEICRLPDHGGWVEGVAVSPDGRLVLSGGQDRALRLSDVATGQSRELKGHPGMVMRVAFSPDGRRAVAGGDDGAVCLWDVATGQFLRRYDGHRSRVECVAFSPDGRRLLSGGGDGDGALRLWDVEHGQELRRFAGHGGFVRGVAFSPDGRRALSAGQDGQVRLWRVPNGRQLDRLAARLPAVETRYAVRVFEGHTGGVRTAALSPDGRYALSGSGWDRGEKTLRLWDLAGGKELRQFHGHAGQIYRVAFSPDGRHALSASTDQTLRLWEVPGGKELQVFRGHTGPVNSVVFAPDGRRALSAGFDGTVRLWDLASGEELRVLRGHTDWALDVAVSPDGSRALSAGHDRTVRLWDVGRGKALRQLPHTHPVECVAFSPDGRRALSGGHDHTIRLWGVDTGRELRTFTRHTGAVNSVCFSRDGRRALSGSRDHTIRLWDTESGRELCRFEGHTGWVWTAVFSADGRHVLSASDDRTVRLWEVPP